MAAVAGLTCIRVAAAGRVAPLKCDVLVCWSHLQFARHNGLLSCSASESPIGFQCNIIARLTVLNCNGWLIKR